MSKIEETLQKMESTLAELKKLAEDRISKVKEDIDKEEIHRVIEKTTVVMNSAMDKVKSISNEFVEEKDLDEFLESINDKCDQVASFTKEKISKIGYVGKAKLQEVEEEITGLFENFMESESFKNAKGFVLGVKKGIDDYFEQPEVKEKVNEIKDKTIDVASKGVELLKKALKTDKEEVKEETKEENNQENQ